MTNPSAETPKAPTTRPTRFVALTAVVFAVSAIWLLNPNVTLVGGPIALGVVDATTRQTLALPEGPTNTEWLVARWLQTGVLGAAFWIALMVRQGQLSPHWVLTGAALLIGLTQLASGIWGGFSSPPRGKWIVSDWVDHMLDAPLFALVDLSLMVFALARVLDRHEAHSHRHLASVALIATCLLVRIRLLAFLAQLGVTLRAASAFVLWVGAAAVACALADSTVAWSGLFAALTLTVASVLHEARSRKNPIVALVRATVGFVVSAELGLLAILAGHR